MYLIPLPSKITAQDGLFLIDHNTAIVLDVAQDDNDLETAKLLQQEIKKVIAITLPIKKVLRSAGKLAENCIDFQYDSMDGREDAYRLTVRSDIITIIACSNRGFLYGAATLIQLCKISRGEIGCVDIVDEPSYLNRGYMLDVSRGRVPTMDSLKVLVDRLALYKINQLQLYMENCLRLDGFEEMWSQTDPFTPEDILELDCYCNIRGVELVPCVATFGHLYDLLRSVGFGKYREMDTARLIWGDIVKSHSKHLDKLSAQVICLNWYYDYGAKEETVKIFSDKGLKQYVCPSVSGYSRLVNAYDMSFTNIREMAKLGHQYHADGFLNTHWGDCGHINMPALSIPGMIYGAAQGWNVEGDRDFSTIDQAISLVEYGDPGKSLVGLLRELSHQDFITFKDLAFFRDYKVYNQNYNESGIDLNEKAKEEMLQVSENQLKTAVTRCEEIFDSLKQNNMGSYANRQEEMLEYYLAARGVALMQRLTLVLKEREYGQDVHPLDAPYELAGKLDYWLMDYCTAWRTGSRESELYRIKEFFGQICSILRKYDAKVSIKIPDI